MRLPSLRPRSVDSMSFDASRPMFRVGLAGASAAKVSELLQALPMLKGEPVAATIGTGQAPAFTLKASVQRVDGTLPTATPYDNNNAMQTVTNGLAAAVDFPMARLGLRYTVPRIDVVAGANGTAGEGAEWRMYAAAYGVLRKLDTEIVSGTGAATPQDLAGLDAYTATRSQAASADIEADARDAIRLVAPNGMGAGEGVHCLAGGAKVLKKLMSTASGQRGQSGFRVDKRTGLLVYHYMGIPYYRCDVDESTTGKLYALNLGGTGVNLIHAYGAGDTFGLALDELGISGSQGLSEYTVHGAFALAVWELEAIWAITGITGL